MLQSFGLPRESFLDSHPAPQDPQTVPRSFLDITCIEPLSRPPSGTVEDENSPVSPSGPNYHYAPRSSRSPVDDFYDNTASYAPYPYSDLRRAPVSSPSPINAPQPLSAPHDQTRFPYAAGSHSLADRQPRYGLPRLTTSSSLLDQRRLSEPSVSYMPHPRYDFPNYDDQQSPHSPESPFIPRVASLGSLRPDYAPEAWKADEHLSPFQPSFSAGISGSPPLQYAVRGEDNTYGPSPPGTSNSSSSTPATANAKVPQTQTDSPGDPNNKKTYSFVALPGNAVRKRPRRRYDEIERLYHCSWPDCNKAYGTLNHLNAHVQMQKHGAKRSPNEFKELRKQWRKAKKDMYDSPGLGPIRRTMSLRDDLYSHAQAHAHSHGHHPYGHHRSFSHNSALSPHSHQLSVAIPHPYDSSSSGGLRYPPDSRGEIDPQYPGAGLDFRQAPTAWPRGGAEAQGQPDIYHSPLSATASSGVYPATSYLDTQQLMESPPQGSGDPYHSSGATRVSRLPPNSMLLTPLVGGDDGGSGYYDAQKRGPSSTSHSNLDRGSGDEY
ncbi:hypothetical protein C8R45DRAFT_917968 [Mycena sanguinolenta]|nr:hypothetical protein C8R45DRAFT_917968 [Mycena sanguinolenta]